jgi:hypothetical protein
MTDRLYFACGLLGERRINVGTPQLTESALQKIGSSKMFVNWFLLSR